MIIEDVVVVAVVGLFIWLVPMRRNGIPGLHGRGRAPLRPVPRHAAGGRTAIPSRATAHGRTSAPGRAAAPDRRPAQAGPEVSPRTGVSPHSEAAGSAAAGTTRGQVERVRPRPVPAAERIGGTGRRGRDRERDPQQDMRVLAELDRTWDAGYADRVAAEMRDRRDLS